MAVINQIFNVLNAAQQQAFGKVAVTVVDTTNLVALGNYVLNSGNNSSKDVWMNALTDQIAKTMYVNKPVTAIDLGITRDETEFGAIHRRVRVKPKSLEHNAEYDLTDAAYDPFKIIVPIVSEMLFSKHSTYMSEVVVTEQQLDTSFKNGEELIAFYDLIYKQLDDSMFRAEKNYDRLATCSFIAEKLKLQVSQPSKTHAINLIQTFMDETGVTLTVEAAFKNAEFLRFVANQMLLYKGYMNTDTDAFNSSDGFFSQTSESAMNFYVLNHVDSKLKTNLYADTYNKELVTVGGYKAIDFWQGIKGATGPAFAFEAISTINILPASGGTAIEQTGIIALMVDKDAIVSCYRKDKSAAWTIPLKGTKVARTKTHMYINDFYENGIVFYVEDLI